MRRLLAVFQVLLFVAVRAHAVSAEANSVATIGMTVSDIDRAVALLLYGHLCKSL